MKPNNKNSAGHSKPIPSYQNSGTPVRNRIWKRVREWKSQLVVSGVVAIFAVLSFLDEILDLPHLLAGAPRTPVNWAEIALDVAALFLIGFLSIFMLSLIESKRKRAEEKIKHLSLVLRAIRNVNQLIARENDRDTLLKGVCDSLVEIRGYHNAWIVLLDESRRLTMVAETGLGKNFLPMVERLKRGELTDCGQRALEQSSVLTIEDPFSTCADCPLSKSYAGRGAIAARLEHGGKVYGLLTTSIPSEFIIEKEEQALFQEVADDIALALHNIELEEESKRAQEALKGAYEIINRSPAVVFLWKNEERWPVEFVSNNVRRLFGYTREEFTSGKVSYAKIVHPEDLKRVENEVSGYSNEKERTNFAHKPYRIVTKDGKIKWIDDITHIRRDPEGNITHYEGIVIDITERKRAAEELIQSELQYRTLGETIPFGVWTTDATGYCTYVSPSFLEMVEMPMEQVQKFGWLHLLPPEDVEPTKEHWLHCIETGEDFEREHRFRTKNGSYRNVLAIGRPIKDDAGKIMKWVGINLDVTERKQAEEALRKAHDELEQRVRERTAELVQANQELEGEIEEHKQAEDALRKSELWMRNIFNSLEEAVFVVTPDRSLVKMNKSGQKMFGYNKDELADLSTEILHVDHEHYVEFGRRIKGAFDKEEAANFEFETKRKNGEIFPTDHTVSLLKNDRGESFGIVSVIRDITERKRAEEKINMLSASIEDAYDGIALTRMNGEVIYANKAACKMFGYSHAEIMKLNIAVFSADQEGAKKLEEGVQKEGRWSGEIRGMRKNKEKFPAILSVSVIKDEKGTPIVRIGVFRDITESKRAEETLRASEERHKFLYQECQAVNLVIGMDGKIIDLNKSALELIGYEKKNVIGKDTIEFVVPEQREAVAKQLAQDIKGEQTAQIQFDIIGKEGTRTLLFAEGHGTIIESGRPVGILISALDITENRKMEAQLIQAERLTAVGTLAYGIAHEFNNILAGILGNAEFGMGSGDSKEVEECFRVIMENCNRAGSITNSLLTLARQRQAKKEVADLTNVVENVLGLVERELEKQNIRVERKFKPVPEIVCDLGELSEVFLNMITNARDAMKPDGGTLTIEVRKRNHNIEIIFADTGGGIPDEIKGRIFEPFVTTKGALGQSEIPGTGLGLFLSIGIISRYHGKIAVESQLGKGSKFTIRIPVTQNQQLPDRAEAEDEGPTVLPTDLKVLLVDDEEAICNVVKKFLEEKGYSVVDTTSGKKGLKLFKDGTFDLVLSDITMPDMDGIKLVSKLKAMDPQIKVVTLTGHVAEEKLEAARKAGADQILAKPFKKEDLYRAIVRALSV